MGSAVVVVSGGSRGLGLRVVQHFLDAGDVVATCSRTPSEAIRQLQEHPSHRKHFFFESLDVANAEAVRNFTAKVVERFKRIDILVNNAAVAHGGLLALLSKEHINEMVDVNLKGSLFVTRECLRVMLRQASGRIINVTSVAGRRGYAGLATYASTKAALIGLTQSLAREVGPKGITVNAVAPGFLETTMSQGISEQQQQQIIRRTPLGRLGRVEDVIPLIAFFASDQASFITGQVLSVDGGLSC